MVGVQNIHLDESTHEKEDGHTEKHRRFRCQRLRKQALQVSADGDQEDGAQQKQADSACLHHRFDEGVVKVEAAARPI